MKKEKKFIILLVLLLSYMVGFATPMKTEAASAKTYPKAEIASSSVVMPNKYSTIGRFISGKTTFVPFGTSISTSPTNSKWYKTVPTATSGYNAYTILHPSDSLKGKIGGYFEHVGEYQGREISIKVTINDWSRYNTVGEERISYGLNNISHGQTGFNWIDQTWQYVWTDNHQNATTIPGINMTFIDLDAHQAVFFSDSFSEKIAKMYITSDTRVGYTHTGGYHRFGDETGITSSNTDQTAQMTLGIDGNNIRFRWGMVKQSHASTSTQDHINSGGEYMAYTGAKLVRSETVVPTKTVTDSDEEEVVSNTLLDKYEHQSYTLTHFVPQETSNFYAKTYQLKDTLPSQIEALNVSKIKVIDETGTNRSSWFTNGSSSSVISFSATANALKSASFYGHYYRIEVEVKIKEGVKAPVSFKNIVSVIKDGETKNSPPVNTTVKEPTPLVPKKEILNDGVFPEAAAPSINGEAIDYNETFDYIVSQSVHTKVKDINSPYQSFQILDTLDTRLDFVAAEIYRDQTKLNEIVSFDETTRVVSFTGNSAFLQNMPMNGETYTLIIRVKINEQAAVWKDIPNTGHTNIGENSNDTNQVIIQPKTMINVGIVNTGSNKVLFSLVIGGFIVLLGSAYLIYGKKVKSK